MIQYCHFNFYNESLDIFNKTKSISKYGTVLISVSHLILSLRLQMLMGKDGFVEEK